MKKLLGALVLASAALQGAGEAIAAYPDHPVRLIVPFPAGGSLDAVARVLADAAQQVNGQPVIVDNRAGATGNIGTQAAAMAAPDGYTMLLQTTAIAINPWLMKTRFDVLHDFEPILRTATTPYVLVVRRSLPVQDLAQFLAFAKTNPGKLTCSTYGIGSPPHLALALLKQAAGVDIVHSPYRGFTQALPDLMSGQLDCSIDTPANVKEHVKAGSLRVLAVTSREPLPLFPDAVPLGKRFPGTEIDGWQGLFVPKGTPPAVVARIRADFGKALHSDDVARKVRDLGFTPVEDSGDTFARALKADYERFGRIVKSQHIRPE